MSFEFTNRIQELTNKLSQIKEHKPEQEKLEEVKELLYGLQISCAQELQNADRKMKKVEKRLKKRAKRVHSESDSVEEIWNVKEERVSQVIGEWVTQYEEKVNEAMNNLQREELIFRTKIEEEDEKYEQQAKLM